MRIGGSGLARFGLMVFMLQTAASGALNWTFFKQLGVGEQVQTFTQDDSALWVGTNKALYTTTADNHSWKQIKPGNVRAIDIEDSLSCVGMDSSLVVLSLSKTVIHTFALFRGAGTINSVIAYSDSDIVVGTNTGVYERYIQPGGGVSWDTLMDGEVVNSVAGMDDYVIVGCESGLYATNFTDTDWTVLSSLPARSLAVADSGFYVLADSGFWYYSLNNLSQGYCFDSIPPAPLSGGSISAFTLSWETKFFAIQNKGVYWSLGYQNTLFALDTASLPNKNVTALYSLDLSSSTLFASTASGALYTIPIDSLNDLGDPIRGSTHPYSTSMGLNGGARCRPFWAHDNLMAALSWPAEENIHAAVYNAAGCRLCALNFPAIRGCQTITLNRLRLPQGTYCLELSGKHGSLRNTFVAP